MRYSLFWDVRQRTLVVSYRRFGTTYWTLKDRKNRLIRNTDNYLPIHAANIPEERRFRKTRVSALTQRITENSGSHSANKASCVLMPSGLVGVYGTHLLPPFQDGFLQTSLHSQQISHSRTAERHDLTGVFRPRPKE